MLSRLAQPTMRRGAHAFFRPSTHMRQFKVILKLIKIFLKLIIIIITGRVQHVPTQEGLLRPRQHVGRGDLAGRFLHFPLLLPSVGQC